MRRCGRPGRRHRKGKHDQNILYEFSIKRKKKKQGVGGTLAHPAEEPGSALTPVPGDLKLSSGFYEYLYTMMHKLRFSAHTQTQKVKYVNLLKFSRKLC